MAVRMLCGCSVQLNAIFYSAQCKVIKNNELRLSSLTRGAARLDTVLANWTSNITAQVFVVSEKWRFYEFLFWGCKFGL